MIEDIAERAFAPARQFVDEGKVPCAALGVVDAQGRSAVRFAGKAAIEPDIEELTREHWFDLASLSKVIATTTMVLQLAEQGRIDLDRPLTDAIPDLRQYDVEFAAERRLTFAIVWPIAHSCLRSFRSTPMPPIRLRPAPLFSSENGRMASRSIRTLTSSCWALRLNG